MTSTHLPWRPWGRLIRPYAFFVSLATAVIAYACAASIAVGSLLDGAPGRIVAVVAASSVALLWAGWWGQWDRLMRYGLFLTAGVWTAVWMILSLDIGFWAVSPLLAGCWAGASGGAWLLEAADRGGA